MFVTNTRTFGGFLAALSIAGLGAGVLHYRSPAAVAGNPTLSRADDPEDESKARKQSANNLKQILLAMHNYNDTYGKLPAVAFHDKDDKPLLSWRVALLPFLEEAELYKQFKLDEQWDSENNKPLLSKMPKVYAPVRGKSKQAFATYCQLFVGAGAPFQITPDRNAPFGAWGPNFPAAFPDGTANTLLVAEAGDAVPWTKPDDIPFDEKKPVPPLGGDFGYGFHAALADGSVLFIRKDIDEKILRNLIMPADGNVIEWDRVPQIGRQRLQRTLAAIRVTVFERQLAALDIVLGEAGPVPASGPLAQTILYRAAPLIEDQGIVGHAERGMLPDGLDDVRRLQRREG